jgi:hypothetical protein
MALISSSVSPSTSTCCTSNILPPKFQPFDTRHLRTRRVLNLLLHEPPFDPHQTHRGRVRCSQRRSIRQQQLFRQLQIKLKTCTTQISNLPAHLFFPILSITTQRVRKPFKKRLLLKR